MASRLAFARSFPDGNRFLKSHSGRSFLYRRRSQCSRFCCRSLGLAITSFAVVICAGFAAYDVRLRENAVLAVALAVFAVLLFIKVLGLPVAIWWW